MSHVQLVLALTYLLKPNSQTKITYLDGVKNHLRRIHLPRFHLLIITPPHSIKPPITWICSLSPSISYLVKS